MKELVEVIAKALVDCPDEVVVTETENDRAIVLELRVAQSDMGKVIGKQGRIAKAIRSVVKAAASKEDKKVVVEITEWPQEHRKAEGKVVEILGKVGDVGLEILSIIKQNDLPLEFPAEVLEASRKIPKTVLKNEVAGRRDLRHLPIVTIDGEDAKDLDDAVYVQQLSMDEFLLGVYIADVSYYDEVTPVGSENPSEEGWYVLDDGEYVLTSDETVQAGTTYYQYVADYKYDVLGNFVNVDGIYTEIDKVAEMVCATPFDAGDAYEIGDVVVYQRGLYEFTSAHTADDPWDASEVHKVDVLDLIASAEPESLTTSQVNALLALLQ